MKLPQGDRLKRLNEIAIRQMQTLASAAQRLGSFRQGQAETIVILQSCVRHRECLKNRPQLFRLRPIGLNPATPPIALKTQICL